MSENTQSLKEGVSSVGSKEKVRMHRLWYSFGILLIGYILYGANRLSWPVLLPELRSAFGLSSAMAGAIASSVLLGQMVTNSTAGAISDIMGYKALLATGVGVFSVFTLLTGLMTRSYTDLLVLRFLVGVGFGIYAVSIYSYVGQAFKQNRGIALGMISTCYSIGGFIGPWFTGLVTASQGWRPSFTYMGAAGLGCSALVAMIVPGVARERFGAESEQARGVSSYLARAMRALARRNVVITTAMNFIVGIGFWVFVVWTPTYFRQVLGMDIARAGFAAGLWSAGSILGSVGGGWVSDRIGRKPAILVSGLASAVIAFLVFTGVLTAYTAVCLAIFVFGFFIAWMWVIPIALAQDSVDREHIGVTTGIVQFAGMFSGVVSAPLFGVLMKTLSMGTMLALGVTIPYAACGLLVLLAQEFRGR